MPVSPLWRLDVYTDWLAGTTALSIVAVDDGYTYDPDDEFLDDFSADTVGDIVPLPSPALGIVGEAVWLTCDDDPPVGLTGIPFATDVAGIWVIDDTGSAATSRAVAFLDRLADSTPLTFVANGGTYLVTFPAGFVTRI
jgi:hypothetical protein